VLIAMGLSLAQASRGSSSGAINRTAAAQRVNGSSAVDRNGTANQQGTADPSGSTTAPGSDPNHTLPQTGSTLPLLSVIGFSSLAIGMIARWRK